MARVPTLIYEYTPIYFLLATPNESIIENTATVPTEDDEPAYRGASRLLHSVMYCHWPGKNFSRDKQQPLSSRFPPTHDSDVN